MADILALVAPFFGLIFLGFFSGRVASLPEDGLAWLNFFIIYLALPALFFDLLSSTPLDQLEGWSFIVVTTLAAFVVYVMATLVAALRGRDLSEAAMQGVAGSYSNIGYMGPGLTLSVLGAPAAVPTALIFCFDNALQFILTPILMAMSGTSKDKPLQIALLVTRKIVFHPFIVASALGIAAAAFQFQTPGTVAAHYRFSQWCRRAVCVVRYGRDHRAAPADPRADRGTLAVVRETRIAPFFDLGAAVLGW
jgi:malonate transporter